MECRDRDVEVKELVVGGEEGRLLFEEEVVELLLVSGKSLGVGVAGLLSVEVSQFLCVL